jgi:hypothetical protein
MTTTLQKPVNGGSRARVRILDLYAAARYVGTDYYTTAGLIRRFSCVAVYW